MITGKIEVARPSKSGKTLGVKVNAKWFSTDLWELQNMVGETITITESNTVPMSDGGSLTYLNAYTTGDVSHVPAARPAATTEVTDTDKVSYVSELLLEFVGRCMAGYPYQQADDVAIRMRCKKLYELGQEILTGTITNVETGPRTKNAPPPPDYPPSMPVHDKPIGQVPMADQELDDDIPFS